MNPDETFPFDAKRALIAIAPGPVVTHEAHRQQWTAILAHRKEIERRLADVFLDLVLMKTTALPSLAATGAG